jgi:hypothetical protein
MQQKSIDNIRLLALDLHAQRFGFAVLEGPSRLLNWGVRGYARIENGKVLLGSISPLLTMFEPELVTIGDPSDWNLQRRLGANAALAVIQREADWRSLSFHQITRKQVKEVFAPLRSQTKYEIATAVTLLFPELVWKLPPVRKVWESENYALPIFDAASIGIACFAKFGDIQLAKRILNSSEKESTG